MDVKIPTIEDARKKYPGSTWFETDCEQMVIERLQYGSSVYWRIWHLYGVGQVIESFDRKRDAFMVANAMSEVVDSMNRIIEIDEAKTGRYGGPDEKERSRLVALTNDTYMEAKRGL